MCRFFSAIITRTGECYSLPELDDSHTSIERQFDLYEGCGYVPDNYAKIEFRPRAKEHEYVVEVGGNRRTVRLYCDMLHKLDEYFLNLEDPGLPDWFLKSPEMQAKAEDYCRYRLSKMIINNDRDSLVGGAYIIGPQACVHRVIGARIIAMMPGARLTSVNRCVVDKMLSHSKISYALNGTTIQGCYGEVEELQDHSKIQHLHDCGVVVTAFDDSVIEYAAGSSRVNYLIGRAKILNCNVFARIGTMMGCSSVYIGSISTMKPNPNSNYYIIDRMEGRSVLLISNYNPRVKLSESLRYVVKENKTDSNPKALGGVYVRSNKPTNVGDRYNIRYDKFVDKPKSEPKSEPKSKPKSNRSRKAAKSSKSDSLDA